MSGNIEITYFAVQLRISDMATHYSDPSFVEVSGQGNLIYSKTLGVYQGFELRNINFY